MGGKAIMPKEDEEETVAALLRRTAPQRVQVDDRESCLDEWCQSLRKQGVRDAADLRRLTDDAVLHMTVDASLKSLVQEYRRNYKGDRDAFSPAEEGEVRDNVDDLSTGFMQWYAVVGIISALMVSITVPPLVELNDVDSRATQAYAVLLSLSFAASVGSIMTLCHVIGMLTGTLIKDRLWFFATFYETDAMLPNVLMIVSVLSLVAAALVRTVQQLGNNPASYVICILYGVFLACLVWWVLCRFPRKYTKEGISGFLKQHGPFVEMERGKRATNDAPTAQSLTRANSVSDLSKPEEMVCASTPYHHSPTAGNKDAMIKECVEPDNANDCKVIEEDLIRTSINITAV